MLRQLVDDLRSAPPSSRGHFEMGRLLHQASARWNNGVKLVSRREAYTRTCAYRDDAFEILLLNWEPGAISPIHDHGDQDCWMMVLSGRLQVDDYRRLDAGDVGGYARVESLSSHMLEAGGLDTRAGRFDLHRVSAAAGETAVSLHVYSGPLREYLIYDELARRCESTRGKYDDFLSPYAAVRR